jgi:hypothetical protein
MIRAVVQEVNFTDFFGNSGPSYEMRMDLHAVGDREPLLNSARVDTRIVILTQAEYDALLVNYVNHAIMTE